MVCSIPLYRRLKYSGDFWYSVLSVCSCRGGFLYESDISMIILQIIINGLQLLDSQFN